MPSTGQLLDIANHQVVRFANRISYGFDPKKCLMIGDSLDTDIDLGIQAGMKTVAVLSDVATAEEVGRCACKPDYVFPNVGKIDLDLLP